MAIALKIPIKDLNVESFQALQAKYPEAKVTILSKPDTVNMDETVFWNIIHQLDWSKGEDEDAIVESAIHVLSECTIEAICTFQDILAEKLFALDKKIYAIHLGKAAWQKDKPFSSDSFLYARAAVVANGKTFYEEVLKHPVKIPKEFTFEALLYIAEEAYERKTGEEFDYLPTLSYETFSNPEGWERTLLDRLLNK